MASDTEHLENIFSFAEIFFDDVDIVFEIDPDAGKIYLISNNPHEEATKITLRDGIQKLIKKRPQTEEMNPVRLSVPIGAKKETMFLLPIKKKDDWAPKYLGIIVSGVETENLEGFLCRNIRKKLEGGPMLTPGSSAALLSRKMQEFKQYTKKLEELNAKRKDANIKLLGQLKNIKEEKKFTEENYLKLLSLVDELEAERNEYREMCEKVIEENNKLIEQLGEVGSVIAKVTEFENERQGYVRLLQEKDRSIQRSSQIRENKELFLDKFKHLILEIGNDGRIFYCNKNVEKFYTDTFDKTGVMGNNYHKVLKSDDLPKIEGAISEAIRDGKETTIDARLHKSNPKTYKTEKVFFKLFAFPLKGGADGERGAGLLMWQV